jgi:organic radical activating enzyme
MNHNLIPLAEHFHSIQGEGTFVGTTMHFIRVAGCCVGAKATHDFVTANRGTIPILSNGRRGSKCQTYDGRYFTCDTDFALAEELSPEYLLRETYEEHICLTGGEPLAYANRPWMKELHEIAESRSITIHIETSGAIYVSNKFFENDWIAVAPKRNVTPGMIKRANEIKLLIDESFKIENVPGMILNKKNIFLSPINDEHDVSLKNVSYALSILATHPSWRLSAQWHKFLGVR